MIEPDIRLATALELLEPRLVEGIKEFDLLEVLKAPPYCLFDDMTMQQPLQLFQMHFVLFNALYRLRDRWRTQQYGELTIHTTGIQLHPYQPGAEGVGARDALRDYYLDWQNFSDTGEQDVERLLGDFWLRMAGLHDAEKPSDTQLQQALQAMQLPTDTIPDRQLLKRQYRTLLHQCHPDKGGDVQQAQAVGKAYALLLPLCD